ncbi:MAG: OadG family protein [Lentisphaeria bacterium]|nr:OadG family protein [Lentisphaeria bacterium]
MQLFLDGLRLMVMGMGVVFLFLCIMILCMNLMSKVLAPFAKHFEPAPAAKPAAKKPSQSDADIAAAAVAAVELFRK